MDNIIGVLLYSTVIIISILPVSYVHSKLLFNQAFAANLSLINRRRSLLHNLHAHLLFNVRSTMLILFRVPGAVWRGVIFLAGRRPPAKQPILIPTVGGLRSSGLAAAGPLIVRRSFAARKPDLSPADAAPTSEPAPTLAATILPAPPSGSVATAEEDAQPLESSEVASEPPEAPPLVQVSSSSSDNNDIPMRRTSLATRSVSLHRHGGSSSFYTVSALRSSKSLLSIEEKTTEEESTSADPKAEDDSPLGRKRSALAKSSPSPALNRIEEQSTKAPPPTPPPSPPPSPQSTEPQRPAQLRKARTVQFDVRQEESSPNRTTSLRQQPMRRQSSLAESSRQPRESRTDLSLGPSVADMPEVISSSADAHQLALSLVARTKSFSLQAHKNFIHFDMHSHPVPPPPPPPLDASPSASHQPQTIAPRRCSKAMRDSNPFIDQLLPPSSSSHLVQGPPPAGDAHQVLGSRASLLLRKASSHRLQPPNVRTGVADMLREVNGEVYGAAPSPGGAQTSLPPERQMLLPRDLLGGGIGAEYHGRTIEQIIDDDVHGAANPMPHAHLVALVHFVNSTLEGDSVCASMLPLSDADGGAALFGWARQANLLPRLVELVLGYGRQTVIPLWRQTKATYVTERLTSMLRALCSAGGATRDLTPKTIMSGPDRVVGALLWQVVQIKLLTPITLHTHPELIELLRMGEEDAGTDELLLRWLNFHLERAGRTERVENWGADLTDGVAYAVLAEALGEALEWADEANDHISISRWSSELSASYRSSGWSAASFRDSMPDSDSMHPNERDSTNAPRLLESDTTTEDAIIRAQSDKATSRAAATMKELQRLGVRHFVLRPEDVIDGDPFLSMNLVAATFGAFPSGSIFGAPTLERTLTAMTNIAHAAASPTLDRALSFFSSAASSDDAPAACGSLTAATAGASAPVSVLQQPSPARTSVLNRLEIELEEAAEGVAEGVARGAAGAATEGAAGVAANSEFPPVEPPEFELAELPELTRIRRLLLPIAVHLSRLFGFQRSAKHDDDGGGGGPPKGVRSSADNQMEHVASLIKSTMDYAQSGIGATAATAGVGATASASAAAASESAPASLSATADFESSLQHAVDTLHGRVFSNYGRWLEYVGRDAGDTTRKAGGDEYETIGCLTAKRWDSTGLFSFQTEAEERRWLCHAQLHQLMLFFLIWGEAANLRHAPELLACVFHCAAQAVRLPRELPPLDDEMMDDDLMGAYTRADATSSASSSAATSTSPRTAVRSIGSTAAYLLPHSKMPYPPNDFLDSVVRPIYLFLNHEVMKRKDESIGVRVMYDDVNEAFWYADRLDLLLPEHLLPSQRYAHLRTTFKEADDGISARGLCRFLKKTYSEMVTWLAVWNIFYRVFMIHLVMLHVSIVLAFVGSEWKGLATVSITHALCKQLRIFVDLVIGHPPRSSTSRTGGPESGSERDTEASLRTSTDTSEHGQRQFAGGGPSLPGSVKTRERRGSIAARLARGSAMGIKGMLNVGGGGAASGVAGLNAAKSKKLKQMQQTHRETYGALPTFTAKDAQQTRKVA